MQEKIANLEIKIFYDSAITTKKVENFQNPVVSGGNTGAHGRLCTSQRRGLPEEGGRATPPPQSATQEEACSVQGQPWEDPAWIPCLPASSQRMQVTCTDHHRLGPGQQQLPDAVTLLGAHRRDSLDTLGSPS